MSWAGVRIGVGARVEFDGEIHEVTEWIPSAAGTEIVLKGAVSLRRMSVVALLSDMRARLIPDTKGPEPDDSEDPAAVVLIGLSDTELQEVRERAEHIREVLTGFRSGSEEAKLAGEPRADFDPKLPLKSRYEAKARDHLVVICRFPNRVSSPSSLTCSDASCITRSTKTSPGYTSDGGRRSDEGAWR